MLPCRLATPPQLLRGRANAYPVLIQLPGTHAPSRSILALSGPEAQALPKLWIFHASTLLIIKAPLTRALPGYLANFLFPCTPTVRIALIDAVCPRPLQCNESTMPLVIPSRDLLRLHLVAASL
jgi:hypothetical protein